jgi:hypothetical protein
MYFASGDLTGVRETKCEKGEGVSNKLQEGGGGVGGAYLLPTRPHLPPSCSILSSLPNSHARWAENWPCAFTGWEMVVKC